MRRYALMDQAGRPVVIAEAADLGDAVLYAHRHGYSRAIPEDELGRASAPAPDRLAEGLRRLGLPEEVERPAADGWPRSLVRELAEAKRPGESGAAVALTAGLPVVRVGHQEFTRVPPGGTTEVRETTPLGERLPVWKPAPRPAAKLSNEPRTVELRGAADSQASLRDAFRRLGLPESAAEQNAVDLTEGAR